MVIEQGVPETVVVLYSKTDRHLRVLCREDRRLDTVGRIGLGVNRLDLVADVSNFQLRS
jgi:hypothetical protein